MPAAVADDIIKVYPRVRGETCPPKNPLIQSLGLSPRARGNRVLR